MTISRTQELIVASFKGVRFFLRNEVLDSAGRRIILHEYPNSKERFVEDLGEIPPTFTITAFVHGPNYQADARSLEAALKSTGPGTLNLPTFGSVFVSALPYTKRARQTTVGEIEFDLKFAVGRDISAPRRTASTQETVFARGDDARDATKESLQEVWDVPTDPSNVSVAEFDLSQSVSAAFEDFKTVVTSQTELERQVSGILNNTQSLVRDGAALSNSLITERDNEGLWQIISLASDNGKGFTSALTQTAAGSQLSLVLSDIKRAVVDDENPAKTVQQTSTDIPLWPETTAGRVKRNKNRLNLINATRVNALVVAYEQAALIDYDTSEDVQAAREQLESAHQRLMRVDTDDRTLLQSSPDVRATVEAVRVASLEVLDQKEQQAFGLTTINQVAQISCFELAYNLYEESIKNEDDLQERALQIRALNPTLPADKLIGELTVLQT